MLRSLTRISKDIRSDKKEGLQVIYDSLHTEWIATKPDIRRRDSPIINVDANGIKAIYFWQFGGAIPAAEIMNDDEFERNKECLNHHFHLD